MDSPAGLIEACEGCGLRVPGGTAGCEAIFEEFVARDFTNVAFFRVHRMMVDTYALQHPERYCKSAKSLAAHLAGLCALLERGASAAVGTESLRRWLDGPARIQKPELPATRGGMTIGELRDTRDAGEYGQAVERWARATWAAYEPLHGTARQWIVEAESRRR